MSPPGSSQTLLSPAELSFIYSSLALPTPIRPDLRTPTQFRPVVAETDILPAANGSARICFSDGTEAIVGVKAELEKTDVHPSSDPSKLATGPRSSTFSSTPPSWLNLALNIPGHRDDDPLPVFLSALLTEALLTTSSALHSTLYLNARWHWKLHVDVLLLSPPLSYPLPLLSLTTHLALRAARLPRRVSEPQDDPLFDDDWAAALPLYPTTASPPPATLLVVTVAGNALFDPSRDELAVAEGVVAVSFAPGVEGRGARLLGLRIVDPPSRLTPLGVGDASNPAVAEGAGKAQKPLVRGGGVEVKGGGGAEELSRGSVWRPPRGGVKPALVKQIVRAVVEPGGVGEEVLAGLAGVDV